MAEELPYKDGLEGNSVRTGSKIIITFVSVAYPRMYRRARYLRLPTMAPRQTPQQSRVETVPMHPQASNTSAFSRRAIRSPSPDHDNVSGAKLPKPSNPLAGRSGIASLLTSPDNPMPRPKLSSRASTREPSPARSRLSFGLTGRSSSPPKPLSRPPSSAAGDRGRSRIWQELREVQRRSRPPTDRSLSPS
jgi:protein SFI1